MNPTDYAALSPLLILLAGGLVLLLIETFAEHLAQKIASVLTLIFFAVALASAVFAPGSDNALLTSWLRFDTTAHFFTVFFLAIGIATTLLASSFFQHFNATKGEYYFFLFASVFGLVLIGSSADFLTLFLGLETLSIALYVLCAYMKGWEVSKESAMKYFIMGSLAAAFLLYGIALIYGAAGTTHFEGLLDKFNALQGSKNALFLGGVALVTLGLAFKAAIVPFHLWAPDVYAGAPTPVTAFMAVGTKVGAFAAFARIFLVTLPQFEWVWREGIAILAIITLIYANFVALRQVHLRRFFAYSGISHAGFLLIPLAAGGTEALGALSYYLVVYGSATLGAFAVLAFLDKDSEGMFLRDLEGLFQRSPWQATVLTFCLLTLAGIPPTAGFFAKFYLFKIAFQAGFYTLVIIALLTTILSAYYYIRMISLMFTLSHEERPALPLLPGAIVVGAASLAAILWFSVFPGPVP